MLGGRGQSWRLFTHKLRKCFCSWLVFSPTNNVLQRSLAQNALCMSRSSFLAVLQVFWNPSCSSEFLGLPWNPGSAENRGITEEAEWAEKKLLYSDCEQDVTSGSTLSFLRRNEKIFNCSWSGGAPAESGFSWAWNPSVFRLFPSSQKDLCCLSLILLLSWEKSSIHPSVQWLFQWFVRIQIRVGIWHPIFLTVAERF